MNFHESKQISLMPEADRIKYLSTKTKLFIIDYYNSLDHLPTYKNFVIEKFLDEDDLFKIIHKQFKKGKYQDTSFTSYIKDDNKLQGLVDILGETTNENNCTYITFIINRLTLERNFIRNTLKFQRLITFDVFKRLSLLDEPTKIKMINVAEYPLKLLLVLSLKDKNLQRKYMNLFHEGYLERMFYYFKNDEFTCLLLPFINSHFLLLRLISSISKDEYLKSSLKYIVQKRDVIEIIKKIKDAKIKIELIDKYELSDSETYSVLKEVKNADTRILLSKHYFPIKDKDIYSRDYNKNFELPSYVDSLPEDMNFGIEIECIGESSKSILLNSSRIRNKYTVKEEETIPDGLEFASDKFSWNKSDLTSIYELCDFAKNNSLKIDDRCGGHIHFDSTVLDSYDAWFMLYYLYTNFESILYLISNQENTLPRKNVKKFAKPISKLYVSNLWKLESAKDKEHFIRIVGAITGIKEHGIDLSHIKTIKTIEFRIPNGSLDANVIIENILLFGSLIKSAKKLSRLPLKKDLYLLIQKLDENDLEETEKFEILLDLLFKEGSTKEIFRRRYYANKKEYNKPFEKVKLDDDIKSFSLKKTGRII